MLDIYNFINVSNTMMQNYKIYLNFKQQSRVGT